MTKCRISIYQIANLNDIIFTFGFVRGSEGVVRAVFDMDYIASDELGNLVGLRIVFEVHFTYAVPDRRLVQHITIRLNM